MWYIKSGGDSTARFLVLVAEMESPPKQPFCTFSGAHLVLECLPWDRNGSAPIHGLGELKTVKGLSQISDLRLGHEGVPPPINHGYRGRGYFDRSETNV